MPVWRDAPRRAAYVGAATTPVAVTPVVPTASVVTSLPTGCARADASGGVYYDCGAVRYQPYYHGSSLVYRPL